MKKRRPATRLTTRCEGLEDRTLLSGAAVAALTFQQSEPAGGSGHGTLSGSLVDSTSSSSYFIELDFNNDGGTDHSFGLSFGNGSSGTTFNDVSMSIPPGSLPPGETDIKVRITEYDETTNTSDTTDWESTPITINFPSNLPPQFGQSHYDFNIPINELSSQATRDMLKLVTSDPEGDYHWVSYASGNMGPFGVNSDGQIEYYGGSVSVSDPPYVFTLRVKDEWGDDVSRFGETTVTINIIESTNSPPQFGQSHYDFDIPINELGSSSQLAYLYWWDYEGDMVWFDSVTSDTGAFSLDSGGAISYTGSGATPGSVHTLTATIRDQWTATSPDANTATVTITIGAFSNTPPVNTGGYDMFGNSAVDSFFEDTVKYTFDIPEELLGESNCLGYLTGYDSEGDIFTFSSSNSGPFSIDSGGNLVYAGYGAVPGVPYQIPVTISDAWGSRDAIVEVNVVLALAPNAPPVFSEDVYTAILGADKKVGDLVTTVTATDADSDTVTYRIVSGNSDAMFSINSSTGEIKLLKAAKTATQSLYYLKIEASNIEASDIEATDTAYVSIGVKDTIGIAGDTHAAEGNSDFLRVKFVRYTNTPSLPLTINYTISWGGGDFKFPAASEADLSDVDNPDNVFNRATFLSGTVTFEGDHAEVIEFRLKAVADIELEGIQQFRVTINEGLAYRPVDGRPDADLKTKTVSEAFGRLDFYVLDGLTLYAKHNNGEAGRDVGDNAIDPITPDNPGIHYNDITQGSLSDCYFMSAVAAVAKQDFNLIKKRLNQLADGTFTVTLYKPNGSLTEPYSFSEEVLIQGRNGAQLSGDYAPENAPGEPSNPDKGKVEIWPILLEMAWAKYKGGYANIQNGTAPAAWAALVGPNVPVGVLTTTAVPASGSTPARAAMEDEAIMSQILNWIGQGKTVLLTTPDHYGTTADPQDRYTMTNSQKIVAKHGYYIYDIARDSDFGCVGFKVYNPWGAGNELIIPVTDLSEVCGQLACLYPVAN